MIAHELVHDLWFLHDSILLVALLFHQAGTVADDTSVLVVAPVRMTEPRSKRGWFDPSLAVKVECAISVCLLMRRLLVGCACPVRHDILVARFRELAKKIGELRELKTDAVVWRKRKVGEGSPLGHKLVGQLDWRQISKQNVVAIFGEHAIVQNLALYGLLRGLVALDLPQRACFVCLRVGLSGGVGQSIPADAVGMATE
eukprot:1036218-Prymnesium_polylepis.3